MDIESAVKNLESFVELSEKSGDFREQQRACSAIGEMLNTLVCFVIILQWVMDNGQGKVPMANLQTLATSLSGFSFFLEINNDYVMVYIFRSV
jgi:hypothetical protein